jgi:hypothetical protein
VTEDHLFVVVGLDAFEHWHRPSTLLLTIPVPEW